MVYTLLTHILKIIATLTNKITSESSIANSNETNQIKNSLLLYSVSIMYKLSKFIKNEVSKKIEDIDRLDADLLRIESIRSNLFSKISSIDNNIQQQNIKIEYALRRGKYNPSANYDTTTNYDTSTNYNTTNYDTDSESDYNISNTSNTSNTSMSTMSSMTTPSKDKRQILDLKNNNLNLKSSQNINIDTDIARVLENLENISNKGSENKISRDIPGVQVMTTAIPQINTQSNPVSQYGGLNNKNKMNTLEDLLNM
jgi:hypothetical protein